MHHRIGLLVIVITSTYPVPTPQPKIRMGLFFYVKILENISVKLEIDYNTKYISSLNTRLLNTFTPVLDKILCMKNGGTQ